MTYTVNRSIQRPPAEKIVALRGAGPPSVSRVIGAEGFLDRQIRAIKPEWSFVGPAITVEQDEPDFVMAILAMELAQPGDVIVVAARGLDTFHCWGAGMTRTAAGKGLAGAVIDGCYTDSEGIREFDFPIFARGSTPRARLANLPGSVNVPVVCGGARVNPGDVVLGNEDGVVVIPPDRLDEVVEMALARRVLI
jgi:4-hydroxy-4-methyl-2-oxoglutarate aldolase